MNPRHARPYVFTGGPLDGHEIEAVARTALYRDANGEAVPVAKGDRLVKTEGGIYFVFARPVKTGARLWRPGKYKWIYPTRKVSK